MTRTVWTEARTRAIARFCAAFGRDPDLVARAPGRVNLIGEHTDYNDGLVLPMAVEEGVHLAFAPRGDGRVVLEFPDDESSADFALDDLSPGPSGPAERVKGVAEALRRGGTRIRGLDGVLAGDLPIGAGLSSSAALGVAAALALAPAPPDALAIAAAVRSAEHERVGVACGIMDPAVSAGARAGHAFHLDCRSLAIRHVPLPDSVRVVLLDSGSRRRLATSAYNERRAQCTEAARRLGFETLRDAEIADLDRLRGVLFARARHVVSENDRVEEFAGAFGRDDAERAGGILDESHESLKTDFEVSSPELDRVVAAAREDPACLGARLTGAGFGGFAVALVRAAGAEEFLARNPGARAVRPAAGAGVSPP